MRPRAVGKGRPNLAPLAPQSGEIPTYTAAVVWSMKVFFSRDHCSTTGENIRASVQEVLEHVPQRKKVRLQSLWSRSTDA